MKKWKFFTDVLPSDNQEIYLRVRNMWFDTFKATFTLSSKSCSSKDTAIIFPEYMLYKWREI
jgi:hypothetical protein